MVRQVFLWFGTYILLLAGGLNMPVLGQNAENASPDSPSGGNTVNFGARDSLVIFFDKGKARTARLVGKTKLSHGNVTLESYEVSLDLSTEIMNARGLETDTGRVNPPSFQREERSFTGRTLAYNLRTEQGRITEARTSIDEGYLLGDVIKQPQPNLFYVQGATYTTCSHLDNPHYSLRATRMKVLDQNWIYTGPIHMRILGIPLPVGLPFGFMPAQSTRRSGFLPPSYGQDQRGMFLRDFGWYFAFNEYMDLQLRFGIWSQGSWEVAPHFRYNKRYRYEGELELDWVRNKEGEPADPDYQVADTRSLRWNHNQTFTPSMDLRANVDLSSEGYLRTVSEDYDDNVRQSIRSSINFNKQWREQGRYLSLSLRQSQSFSNGSTQSTLPNLTFRQQSRQPFAPDVRGLEADQWYQKITYSYRANLQNEYRFDPLPADTLRGRGDTAAVDISWYDALISPSAYRRATGQNFRFSPQVDHNIPVTASFSVGRIPGLGIRVPINLTPQFTYTEQWAPRSIRRTRDPLTGRVETNRVPGFTTVRTFNTGINANTEFFGIFPWRIGPFDGFRHVARPEVSFTYQPDFRTDFWGYYRTYEGAGGRTVPYSVIPGVQGAPRQSISLRFGNVLQTKRVRPDSIQQRRARPTQLLTLDASTDYNFAADSLRLSPIRLNARTNAFDRYSINARASLSPYATGAQGQEIDRILLRHGGFLRLIDLKVSGQASFGSNTTRGGGHRSGGHGGGTSRYGTGMNHNRGEQQDTTGFAPTQWSMSLSGNFNYSKRGNRTRKRAIINSSFTLGITPSMTISGNTGYDLLSGEVSTTSLDINRELHDWIMSLHWIPFGDIASFRFTLRLKTGPLQDLLKLTVPQSGIRDRFSTLRR